MKNFKKYLLGFALVTTFTLTSCNNETKVANESQTTTEAPADNPQTQNVEITINDTVNDKEILTESAEVKKDGLQTYLEENHQAKFENGMMTELEGISQDTDANQYWMYYVNGEMAEVGIGDYEVKDGDKIEFKFEQM